MKTKNLLLSGALFAGLLMFNACDDSPTVDTPAEPTVDTDITEQQIAIDDVVESVFDELDATLSTDYEMGSTTELKSAGEQVGCPTVIVDRPEDAKYPKTVTFDYGTENCEDKHGRLKRGKIIVTKTGPHWQAGSERTVVFEDFFVNDNSVEGSRKYKNEGLNEDENWEFSVNIDVTVETTEEISWTKKADKIRTLIAGGDTKGYPWDDQFLITGTSSGTSSMGYSVAREITTPILRKRDCRFAVSGIIEIVKTKDGEAKTTWLDYGDGTCDYKAVVTDEEGNTKEIMLGKRFKKK
ncbi:hypothetical protein [Labilibacter marinus]|uniref:hypothetical protein n=1 Tax=Labilibacter marinus TaxID=1477105 RepID=UPI000831CF6B|nr:hypothetical protein [Labilibacter marinus]